MKIALFYERRRFEHLPANAKWRKRIMTILFLFNSFSQIKCVDQHQLLAHSTKVNESTFASDKWINQNSNTRTWAVNVDRAVVSGVDPLPIMNQIRSNWVNPRRNDGQGNADFFKNRSTKSQQIAVSFIQKFCKEIESLPPAIRRTMWRCVCTQSRVFGN